MDILGRNERTDGHREWWTGGAWLRPGERVAVIEADTAPLGLNEQECLQLYEWLQASRVSGCGPVIPERQALCNKIRAAVRTLQGENRHEQ